MPGCSPAELPTRMNDVTPTRASSSTAIAVEGQPMPGRGRGDVPAPVEARHRAVLAVVGDLPHVGEELRDERDPERVARQQRDRLTSPGAMPMWYCRSVRPTWALSTVVSRMLPRPELFVHGHRAGQRHRADDLDDAAAAGEDFARR